MAGPGRRAAPARRWPGIALLVVERVPPGRAGLLRARAAAVPVPAVAEELVLAAIAAGSARCTRPGGSAGRSRAAAPPRSAPRSGLSRSVSGLAGRVGAAGVAAGGPRPGILPRSLVPRSPVAAPAGWRPVVLAGPGVGCPRRASGAVCRARVARPPHRPRGRPSAGRAGSYPSGLASGCRSRRSRRQAGRPLALLARYPGDRARSRAIVAVRVSRTVLPRTGGLVVLRLGVRIGASVAGSMPASPVPCPAAARIRGRRGHCCLLTHPGRSPALRLAYDGIRCAAYRLRSSMSLFRAGRATRRAGPARRANVRRGAITGDRHQACTIRLLE